MSEIEITKKWFRLAVPEPTEQNKHVQFGVHLEEVCEMIQELMVNCFEPLEGELSFGEQVTKDAYYALFRLADHLKQGNVKMNFSKLNRVAFLDSLCDQMVTTIGIAHMLQMDIAGGFEEVNQSNWSKFDEHGIPIFNENKKIMKGPNYRKPTLDPFV